MDFSPVQFTQQQVSEILAWIIDHQDDEDAFDDHHDFPTHGTPQQIFHSFCAKPDAINQYDENTPYQRAPDGCGCNFFYISGYGMGTTCGQVKTPGSNRCLYHSQVIFSEPIWDRLTQKRVKSIKDSLASMFPYSEAGKI